jgi:UDP-GlcNAc:undecaprenyl-phosphate GlcNAc-1-phosphate transferase
MITYLVAFLSAVMVSTILTVAVRNCAVRYGWVDQAKTSRKIHGTPVPRLGGIAIVCGFFAPLFGLLLVDSSVGRVFVGNTDLVSGLFCCGISTAFLGLYDDVRGSGAKLKFAIQFAAAGALYSLGFRIDHIANPFGDPLPLGMLSIPFTVFWIVGIINAMNLIDGLDGLAGGVALFAVAANFFLAFAHGDVLLCLVMASLGGAVLGFLIFNFNPASIFMGDTGSMFLGFVLATVSIKTSTKSGTAVAMLVPILALGLPIMDTLLAVLRRSLLGRAIFSSDKEHIHHRLMSVLVVSHRSAVLILYGVCCLFAMTALGMAYANSAQGAMLLLGISVVVFFLIRKLGYLSRSEMVTAQGQRKRNIELRTLVKQVNGSIANAQNVEGIWDSVRPLAEALQASSLQLRVQRHGASLEEDLRFETRRLGGAALPLEISLDITWNERKLGSLDLAWGDGRGEVDRDEELALELVADSIAKAARSMEPDGAPWSREGLGKGKPQPRNQLS